MVSGICESVVGKHFQCNSDEQPGLRTTGKKKLMGHNARYLVEVQTLRTRMLRVGFVLHITALLKL